MNRLNVAVFAISLATLSCQEDPARAVKIVPRPIQPNAGLNIITPGNLPTVSPVTKAPRMANPAVRPPQPGKVTLRSSPDVDPGPLVAKYCPPPPEGSRGPGKLTASGPCNFVQTALVSCEGSKDDFYGAFTRTARNGSTLVTYINVEAYHGPGSYERAQVFVAVQSGTNILRWSNDNVAAIVGPGEAFIELPQTRLEPEAMLVDCSRLIGPESNYQYQCSIGGGGDFTRESGAETISGKLVCSSAKK